MSNPTSSAVVFSGYHPIEVTDNDFRKAVQTNNDCNNYDNISERKKRTPQKSAARRSWGLLSSSRKKKDTDSDCKESVSGFSNTGQQSIASKTVDSGTTIKASNLHEEQVETKLDYLSSAFGAKNFTEANAFVDSSSGNKYQKQNTDNGKNSNSSSNRHIRPPKPWKSLKRLVVKGRHNKQQSASITSQSSSDLTDPGSHVQRRHAKSHDGAESLSSKLSLNADFPMRKRFHSDGVDSIPEQHECFDAMSSKSQQHAMDKVIRGRWDGIDVLSLGPASRASLHIASSNANANFKGVDAEHSGGDDTSSFDPLHSSFTDVQSSVPPSKIVDEMIWTSAGMDQAEIILEGFHPGCNDRWGVRIASLLLQAPSGEQSTGETCNDSVDGRDAPAVDSDESTATNTTDNDGSTTLPMAELWDSLWGVVATPPPIPSHMNMQTTAAATTSTSNTAASSIINNSDEDPLSPEDDEYNQKFLAMCNVPVDLDDDAFMIGCKQHVKSVHEVAMVSLQDRRFDCAISIFEKLQRGVEGNQKYIHLVASTSHNIGMIQLCQGNYQEALTFFQKAVEIRKECLPANHPDIAVSLQREGMAHFALASIIEALKCFEAALAICTSMDNTRAKLLNNIGVARYQLEDYAQALKSFTSALEIQRPWLEGPIRRESIIYSASTILSNMGKVYLREGDHDLAYFVFEEACLMQTSVFRMDHAIVLNSMDNMARAQTKNENYTEALKIFTSLHRSQKKKFGHASKACIETLGMVGMSHFKLLDYDEAQKCMKQVEAWQIHKGRMDDSHPSVKITTNHIQQIKRCLHEREPVWV